MIKLKLNTINKNENQKGIALITSILILSVLLAIVFTLSAVLIPKIRTSSESKKSVIAIFAADSALEWCLYVRNHDDTLTSPIMGNGSEYFNGQGDPLLSSQCTGEPPIKVVGSYPRNSSSPVTR